MMTEPATLSAGEPLKLKPARIPAGTFPEPVGIVPGWISPLAMTTTVVLAGVAAAWLTAAMPDPPD